MSKYALVLVLAGAATVLAFLGQTHGEVKAPALPPEGVVVIEENIETMSTPAQTADVKKLDAAEVKAEAAKSAEALKAEAAKAKATPEEIVALKLHELELAEKQLKCCMHHLAHCLNCLAKQHDGEIPPCIAEKMADCGLKCCEKEGCHMVGFGKPCDHCFCGKVHVFHHFMGTPEMMEEIAKAEQAEKNAENAAQEAEKEAELTEKEAAEAQTAEVKAENAATKAEAEAEAAEQAEVKAAEEAKAAEQAEVKAAEEAKAIPAKAPEAK